MSFILNARQLAKKTYMGDFDKVERTMRSPVEKFVRNFVWKHDLNDVTHWR